jgi:lipopolysaccharide/colanic/teichoic acid biosynthesis glycosyltransferase
VNLKCESQLALKRALDFTAALLGLLVLCPMFGLIGVSIWLDSRGGILFKLRAAGLGKKAFDQWKFRTMVEGAQQLGHPFETSVTDPRITRVGRFLRRWSLDELPQLWNVFRGEMSLVGPRPAFIETAARYSTLEAKRLRMRPGLTGLAQVRGRNLLPWPERVALDIEYIEHYSLWTDVRILAQTIPVVFRSKGVYGEDGKVTMHDLA